MKTRALLLTLLTVVLSVTAFTQAPTRAQLQKINARYMWESGGFSNVSYLPLDTAAGAEVGAKAYKNGIEYTKDTLRWRPTASGGTFIGDNMANTNLDLTGNRTHNGKGHYFVLDTLAYLQYMVYRNDPFLGNKYYSKFYLDSTINGFPFRFVSALRNWNNTTDSIHTQFGVNQDGATIYNYGLNGNRYGIFEFKGNAAIPQFNTLLYDGTKQGQYTFGAGTAYLAPQDSFRLKLPDASGAPGTKMMVLQSGVGGVYTPAVSDMGNFMTGLSGDVTATGPGVATATLSNTGVIPGTYTNLNALIDAKGRIITATNGVSTATILNNVGPGYRRVTTPNGSIKTEVAGYGIIKDSVINANAITDAIDTTSANHVVTQSDLNDAIAAAGTPPGTPDNAIQYRKSDGTFGGDSLQYYPTENKILTSQDYIQYGRPVVGHFQDSAWNYTSGKLWMLYPRHSNGTPGQAVDPSWGADTLQPFYSDHGNALYDVNEPENAVVNLIGFGKTGNYRPMMRFAFEQNFYNTIEMHLATKPRLMNPNDEIRHWSWTIDDITGNAHLDTRATQVQYSWSKVDDVDYNRPFLGIGNNGVLAQTWGANGTMSVTHGNSASAKTIGMVVDTASGGTGVGAFYVSTNTPFLYIGSSAGSTGIDISNPATTGGSITMHKSTTTFGKALGISGLPNSSAVGLYVTTGAVGYVHNVSTDGNGYANVNTVGTMSINRDPLGFNTWDKMFQIYNNFNPNDSIYHIRANGDTYHKGMITANADSTASATGGFVYRDKATGNFRITAAPGGISSINSHTGPAIIIQGGTALSVDNSTLNTVTFNVTPNSSALPHTLDALYTTAGNTGSSETDLFTYTLPAGELAIDGRTMNFEIDGEFNDNTITAQLKLYFGGNVTLNTGAVSVSTAFSKWRIKGYIMRTSSSTAHVTYEMHAPGLATPVFLSYNNLTSLDFTTTNVFKISAQAAGGGASNSDITAHSWQLLYKPQPQ